MKKGLAYSYDETLISSLLAEDAGGGRQILLDADAALQQPSTQLVYSSLAAVTTQCGRTPTEWFVGNMASGNWTGVGGTALTAGAGTIRYQKTVPGWNGTDMTSFDAVEFVNGASLSQFVAGNTTLLDVSQALTLVVQYRILRPPAAARGLFGKKASTAAGTAGWAVYLPVSGGMNLIVADGSTQVLVQPPSGITGVDGVMSGAVQWSAFKMDPAGNAQVLALRGSGTAGAIPAGTKTNSETFKISGGVAGLQGCECLQIMQWGWFVGSEATSFDINDLNELDNWCRPHTLFGSTYVRQSMTAPDVAVDASGVRVQMCHGSAVSTDLTHVAHGYHANATKSTQKLGLVRCRGSQTSSDTETAGLKKRNRVLEGDNFANAAWAKTNVTATVNAGEDPAGYTGAASLTASADNGIVIQNFTGEDNERHTISFYGKRNQGSDVAARLILWDSGGAAEVAGVDITLTSLWQRFSLSVDDSLITMTTLQWRLRINTNTHSILGTFAQAEYDGLTPFQLQRDSLVDRDDDEVDISNADFSRYDAKGGRIETTVVGYADEVRSTGCFIFSADSGASFQDRHFIQRDALTSATDDEVRIYDSAGNVVSMLDLTGVTNTDEVTYVSEWEATQPLPGRAQRAIAEQNGTVLTTGTTVATAGWASGVNADRVSPGSRIAGDTAAHLAHLEGIVESLKIYGRR